MTELAMNESSIPMPGLAELVTPGAAAVRKYWRPFLLLQGCAALLVVTYYGSTAVQRFCEHISEWHVRGGVLFSGTIAAIAGGLLPEVAKRIVPGPRIALDDDITAARTERLNDVVFACCVFAINGMMTDLQYRWFGRMFGNDGHFLTAIKKMLFDQFITTPIYGITYWAVVYRWRALRYSLPALFREMDWRWYVQHVGPLLLPCWCFWIPMVTLVYMMPASLQYTMASLALAAWSLLMVFIATKVDSPRPDWKTIRPSRSA